MSDTKLGILLEGATDRDAIHCAIAPVTTTEILHPGQHVGLVKGSTTVVTAQTKKLIGIVDPFLKTKVFPGDQFYLLLYQQTVTGMKHRWEHPAFVEAAPPVQLPPPAVDPKAMTAKIWLEGFADEVGLSYRELIEAAESYLSHDQYLIDGGRWEGQSTPPEFWDHYEIVTGTTVPESKRGGFFSCSC